MPPPGRPASPSYSDSTQARRSSPAGAAYRQDRIADALGYPQNGREQNGRERDGYAPIGRQQQGRASAGRVHTPNTTRHAHGDRRSAVALADPPHTESVADPSVPRRGRAGRTIPWKRVRRWLYVLLGLAVIGPFAAFAVGWVMFDVKNPQEVATLQVARYQFADGSPLATSRPENINREIVRLDRVPQHVRQAVLAAEDKTFYTNAGFDFTGIARAVFNQLTGGIGGGSTITQQYIKVSTANDDATLWRKYEEVVLAVKISRERTKDQILEDYLNTIYLGRGAYGIQAASVAYFGKPVDQLSVSEGAMLAGMIQAPSRWDPAKSLPDAQRRWEFVLNQMAQEGWVSVTDRPLQVFPTTVEPGSQNDGGRPGDDKGLILDKVEAELAALNITEEQIRTQGLTVVTTIDPVRQAAAVEAVTAIDRANAEIVPEGQEPTDEQQAQLLRTALVSVAPKTGAVVAYYGGSDGNGFDYAGQRSGDNPGGRQAGSSFKPFVLAALMEVDPSVGLGSMYDGSSPRDFPGRPGVRNNEGYNCARCTVKTAMTNSINTAFYEMGLKATPQKVAEVARAAGVISTPLAKGQGGIALGDEEVYVGDMATAIGTLASDGMYRPQHFVSSVTTADGRVLFSRDAEAPGEQRIPADIARNVTEAMMDVAGHADRGLDGGRPVAAKTGTVQAAEAGQNKDSWMVGATPSLSTAVWVGTNGSDPIQDERGRAIFGRMIPGQIWQSYMNAALDGTDEEEFSRFVPRGDGPRADPGQEPDRQNGRDPSTREPGDLGLGLDQGDDRDDRRRDSDGDGIPDWVEDDFPGLGDRGNGSDRSDGSDSGDRGNDDSRPGRPGSDDDDRADTGDGNSGDDSGDSGDSGDGRRLPGLPGATRDGAPDPGDNG